MELLKDIFIYNKFIIFNFLGFINDIENYLYLREKFKGLSNLSNVWREKRFRVDWFGLGYGVLNYDEEFFTMADEYQRKMIVSDLRDLFMEFETLNFYEILTLKQKRIVIDGEITNSILIYFRPIFYYTSKWNIINTLILIFSLIYFLIF
jgi:hypothetical protein